MIKIKAEITVFGNGIGRIHPFINRYRPHFDFGKGLTSGQIILLDREEFFPGEKGIVEIDFLFRNFLDGNLNAGSKFIFSEGNTIVGEGIVLEILED